MKQTAVEWLVREFTYKTLGGVYTTDGIDDVTHLVEQAKEMEKEQIKEAYSMGRLNKSIKEFNNNFKTEQQ
jgi:hypothetical protein